MGNGQTQVAMNSTSTCPIENITRALSFNCRVILTNETYTTKTSSSHRSMNRKTRSCMTIKLDLHIVRRPSWTSTMWKRNFCDIHGLRQFQTCHLSWNMDFNAERNTHVSGLRFVRRGRQAPNTLLCRKHHSVHQLSWRNYTDSQGKCISAFCRSRL